tara:strand:- start:144 stop:383 length:240 start_codon:yes stop_codon:yes gene_type:complete
MENNNSDTKFNALRDRVKKVRDNFRSHPEIKWLPMFRKENPNLKEYQIRNIYYLQSTNEAITVALEKHWEKYNPNKKSN